MARITETLEPASGEPPVPAPASGEQGEQKVGGQNIRSKKKPSGRLEKRSRNAYETTGFRCMHFGGNCAATDRASEGFRRRAGRVRRATLMSIIVALVLAGVLLVVVVSADLFTPMVTVMRRHDYETALSNVLELQALALSEAKAGQRAFFVAHTGCANPLVWQNARVLENFEHMVAERVEVKLIAGSSGNAGEALPTNWPEQFAAKLKERGLDGVGYTIRPRELRNHSVVAGSERRRVAYICLHQEDSIYPTNYFIIRDEKVCKQWYKYLLRMFRTADKPPTRPQ